MSQASQKFEGVDISETVTLAGKVYDKAKKYNWREINATSELMMIDKTKLVLDLPYQRAASNSIVLRIRGEWEDELLGTIMVSFRDGLLNVLDGMHRVLAALGRADIKLLPCRVFYGLTLEEEATLFARYNTKRNSVKIIDRFKAMLIAGDSTALKVEEILAECGLTVSNTPSNNKQVKAVAQLSSIMDSQGEAALRWVVSMAVNIASLQNDRVNDELLRGLSWVHRRVLMAPMTLLDLKRRQQLQDRLAQVCCAEFNKQVRNRKALTGQKNNEGLIGQVLLDMINTGLRRKFVASAVKEDAR
jgi:hypothetical protein